MYACCACSKRHLWSSCVCIYVCMYVCMYVCIYMYIYIMHAYMYVFMYVCSKYCTCVNSHGRMYMEHVANDTRVPKIK